MGAPRGRPRLPRPSREAGGGHTPVPSIMATGNVVLDEPRPVEVLHDGHWVPGWLLAYRHDPGGWRGMVRYRVDLAQYLQWRGEHELRRAPDGGVWLPPARPDDGSRGSTRAGCLSCRTSATGG